jgi:putative transposase
MEHDIGHEVALFKYKTISPILAEPGRAQMAFFRNLESSPLDYPGKGRKIVRASTMKGWLRQYKKLGFSGLHPKKRSDLGARKHFLGREGFDKIKKFRLEHSDVSVALFYRKCLTENILGNPPMCEATMRRFLKIAKLNKCTATKKERKRFEMESFGELWTGDFMHGPQVLETPGGQKKRKAILLSIIDDHSRMIVGSGFGFLENTQAIELIFKEAILTYGLPARIYLDNGPSFSSKYLLRTCAELQIGLVHSKPYDSPSRGKIERFFRTVRGMFLADLQDEPMDLRELNEQFNIWLRSYHNSYHKGIGETPLDRHLKSINNNPLKRVESQFLDECFLSKEIRRVNKDATLSFRKIIYEVPARYIGEKVEIGFPLGRPKELYLYEDQKRVARLTPVDPHFNGKYRPSPKISDVSLQDEGEN